MTLNPNKTLLLTDVETTGLDEHNNELIEVGFMAVSLDLKPISVISRVIVPDERLGLDWDGPHINDFVRKMHQKNGLRKLIDTRQGVDLDTAEADFMEWYVDLFGEVKMPLCGSSVQFDRTFLAYDMPELSRLFHYRNIDVSTVKNLAILFNPEVAEAINEGSVGRKLEMHRVVPDMEDTLAELKAYLDNFLICTRPEL